MSWDISVVIDTGGKELAYVEDVRNLTYNNGKILDFLGVHPEGKDQLTCAEWLPLIKKAMIEMLSHDLTHLEPQNGWGGCKDVEDFLMKLKDACENHPKAKLKWS